MCLQADFFAGLLAGQVGDQEALAFLDKVVEEKREAAGGGASAAMQRLIVDLNATRNKTNAKLVDRLVGLATANHYDDFLGCALPKLELLRDTQTLPAIHQATLDGKYDE